MLEHKPFFSVIIPTFNRLELLQQAINSVLNQTFDDYEVIVVDDGSDDGTSDYLNNINNKTLFTIVIEHCGFAGKVRNQAILKAKGKFLAFLDSDDLWLEQKLEKQYQQIIANPLIKIFHTKEKWLKDNKEISQSSQRHQTSGYIFNDALQKCILGPSTVAIETNFMKEIGMFNERLEIAEDYECWLRALSQNKCCYIDEALTIKQAGAWSALSSKYDHIEIFRISAIEKLLDSSFPFSQIEKTELLKTLKHKLALYLAGSIKRDKFEETQQIVAKLSSLCKNNHYD